MIFSVKIPSPAHVDLQLGSGGFGIFVVYKYYFFLSGLVQPLFFYKGVENVALARAIFEGILAVKLSVYFYRM